MKNIKILVLLSFLISGVYQPCHAQFLKRLQKSVENSAERAVIRKAEQKTAEEVEKGMEEALENGEQKEAGKKEPADGQKIATAEGPADKVYEFEYHYEMQVTSGENTMNMKYYLQPDAPYFGMEMNREGMEMFMVMDTEAKVVHTFMKMGDRKMSSSTSMDSEHLYENASEEDLKEYTIKKLPNKQILGYDCEGVQMENEDSKNIFYYTNDAGVSFNSLFNTRHTQKVPPELKKYFDDNEKNLILYMEVMDKTKKADNRTTLECVSFGPTEFTLDTSGYASY